MVYDNELVGVKQADADALTQLLEQEPNTRFLGTSVGVMLYRFGNQFYDSSKVASKRKVTSEQLIALQSTKDSVGNELNYKQTINLKDGVHSTINWMKENYKKNK